MAAGRIVIEGFMPALDLNGDPVPGARLTFYDNETTTLVPVYTNPALTVPHTNPVVANSGGQFPSIFADAANVYTVTLADGNGATVGFGSRDDVRAIGASGEGGGETVEFSDFTELQAGAVVGKAIDPATAILGMPAVTRDVVCDARPVDANENDDGGILAMFDGEQTYQPVRLRSRLRDQTILGAPTTGYQYTAETALYRGWLLNRAGYNHETDSNGGRTGAVAMRLNITSTFGSSPSPSKADGDTTAYNFSAFINAGVKVGATHFLANPAIVGMNGDMLAGAAGAYMQGREIIYDDGGFDVAAIHDVANFTRSKSTGALGCTWIGYRPQSLGSQPIDAFYSSRGKSVIGLDLTTAEITGTAIALAADQTISFDASNTSDFGFPCDTDVGDSYIKLNSVSRAYEFWIDGGLAAEIDAGGIGGARGVVTLPANGTTWTLSTANVLYVTANTVATTVAGLASPLPVGTEFEIHFNDALTTLNSDIAGNFSLNGFLDVTPPLGATMRFIQTASYVLETSRSFPGLNPGFTAFDNNFTTPLISSGRNHYRASNTSATTITDILNGGGSQEVTILATNANTTIQHNASTIYLATGADVTLRSGEMITLVRDAGPWREKSRNFSFDRSWLTVTSTSTAPAIAGANRIKLAQPSAVNLLGFAGPSDSQRITVLATNGNTTLVHNGSLMVLKSATNVTLSAGQIVEMVWDASVWRECSRNF